MNWIINIFRRGRHEELRVGSRVRTKVGIGTVIGGTVVVRYDGDELFIYNRKRGVTNSQDAWTHNLKEFDDA